MRKLRWSRLRSHPGAVRRLRKPRWSRLPSPPEWVAAAASSGACRSELGCGFGAFRCAGCRPPWSSAQGTATNGVVIRSSTARDYGVPRYPGVPLPDGSRRRKRCDEVAQSNGAGATGCPSRCTAIGASMARSHDLRVHDRHRSAGDPLTVRATVRQAGLRFYDRPPAGAVVRCL